MAKPGRDPDPTPIHAVDTLWGREDWGREPTNWKVLRRAGTTLVNGLTAAGASAFLGDAENRRDWFTSLDPDMFGLLVANVNAAVRDRRVEHAGFTKSEMFTRWWVAPRPSDRRELLDHLLRSAQYLAFDSSVSVEEGLARAAVLIGIGINYIHPFANGNGRTSRTVSYLIAEGFTEGNAQQLRSVVNNRSSLDTDTAHLYDELLGAIRMKYAPHLGEDIISWRWKDQPVVRDRNGRPQAALTSRVGTALNTTVGWEAVHDVAREHGFLHELPPTAAGDGGEPHDVQKIVDRFADAGLARELVRREARLRVEAVELYIDTVGDTLRQSTMADLEGGLAAPAGTKTGHYIARWAASRAGLRSQRTADASETAPGPKTRHVRGLPSVVAIEHGIRAAQGRGPAQPALQF